MEAPKNKSSGLAYTIRWVARGLGTLIALFALFGIAEKITDMASFKSGRTIPGYLTGAAFLLVFVGCIVGWFKDLAASLFILGGILLILVTALAFPGSLHQVYFFSIPALPGLLFLYAHLAGKKKK
jgi:hypothetical protein